MHNDKYRRGDVYYADLGDGKGSVQNGNRPVIIVQNNTGNQEGPTLVVVPITTQLKKWWLPVHVRLSTKIGLPENSMAMCEQIATIDKSQVGSYIGRLPPFNISKLNTALLISLGLMPIHYNVSYRQGPDEMILTLCRAHLQPFFDDPDYIVRRLDRAQAREPCVCCDKLGYDYRITHIWRENRHLNPAAR